MRFKTQKGFTLIELMAVIVILGILVAIIIPNFSGAQDRAKVASVKSNMHVLQMTVEMYAVDWDGVYPDDVTSLRIDSEPLDGSSGYWKEFSNPFSNKVGLQEAYDDEATVTKKGGVVTYSPMLPLATSYFIYGYNKSSAGASASRLVERGQSYVLSNS